MDNLRVFSTFSQKPRTQKGRKGKSAKAKKAKHVRPPRKSFSRQEILQKLQKHNGTPKVDLSKTGQRLGMGFMQEQVPGKKPLAKPAAPSANEMPQAGEGKEVKGDVGLNKPDDPMTGEKLKALLSTGAFAFNDKEKDVLSKILGTK